jgi:hypothetical protein
LQWLSRLHGIPEKIMVPNSYIEVTDIRGRTILKASLIQEKSQIDLSAFDNGVYFLNILQSNSIYKVKKIVLAK